MDSPRWWTPKGDLVIETLGNGIISGILEKLLQDKSAFKLLLLLRRTSWKGPLLGLSVALVTTAVVLFIWRQKPIDELQKEIGTLRIENAQLITRSRILVRETRDLRRTNATYVDDNKALTERIHTLEHRTLDLLETITEKEGSIQIQLIKQIYKEQILTLRIENAALSKKNETLCDTLNCSICFSQEANCLIRPCGHTLCSDCYKQIEKQWSQSSKYHQNIGPSCPFCRHEVIEVLPKYH